jgi:hypothetical protein
MEEARRLNLVALLVGENGRGGSREDGCRSVLGGDAIGDAVEVARWIIARSTRADEALSPAECDSRSSR